MKLYTDIFLYNIDYNKIDDFSDILIIFKQRLIEEAGSIISKRDYSLTFLVETIVEISRRCFFEVPLGRRGHVKVIESPKKLFPDLIDTHNRIVAFVDILGFSDMIRKYDSSANVQLLIDLKESLDSAVEFMQKNYQYSENQIESKLFSDCLCLSTPYFDNDTDFPYQFGIIMLGLKMYQYLLLNKGYLVRGGVAIGSYYSDGNMIFSGALVKAVEYEKNGSTVSTHDRQEKPPRILVCPEIINKLHEAKIHATLNPFFSDGLIKDEQGEIFINPIFYFKTNQEVFDNVLNTFLSSDDGIITSLGRILANSIEQMRTILTPEIELLTHNGIISKLQEKIEEFDGKSPVAKYIWMKEVVEWVARITTSEKYSYYKVRFKEILNN